MDFAALQFFKAVVDEGGISAAAKKLHRVQSNVTTRIKQLEASLGTQLFIRDKRRLALSPAGEMFLGYAEQLLKLSNQARGAVLSGKPQGSLRIGTLESTAASRLPPLLSRYHRKYPAVRIELTTGTEAVLVKAVLERKVDAAFVVDIAPSTQLEVMPTFAEELVVVAEKWHPRIRSARDVRTDTLIAFPPGCAYRQRMEHWFAQSELAPERTMDMGSYHAIVACVASGTGIAIMPRSVLRSVRGGENLSVNPFPKGKIRTCFIWRRGESSPALNALKAEIAQFKNNHKPRAPKR